MQPYRTESHHLFSSALASERRNLPRYAGAPRKPARVPSYPTLGLPSGGDDSELSLEVVIEGLPAESRKAALEAFPGGQRFTLIEA